jgi:hypothetical protein
MRPSAPVAPYLLALTLSACALSPAVVTGCRRAPDTKAGAKAGVPLSSTKAPLRPVDPRCPAAVEAARTGGLDPDRYVVPTSAERNALRDAVLAIVARPSKLEEARAHAASAGFEVVDLELPDGHAVLLREQQQRRRGGGVYVFRPDAASRLAVQAPHTFFDEGTLPLACELFARGGARALFVETAHRYKAAPQTPSGAFPADVAHARDSFFQAATEGLVRGAKPMMVVQLHGFGEREPNEAGAAPVQAAVISTGIRMNGQPLVAHAAIALSRVLASDATAAALGTVARFPDDYGELGATTNVQGTLVRDEGSHFLHLELGAPLRRRLLDDGAFRASFLATLADVVATKAGAEGATAKGADLASTRAAEVQR